jgi:hypothetical protein
MLRDEIEKKLLIKKDKKKLELIELTCQTRVMSYETDLTTYNTNYNKL